MMEFSQVIKQHLRSIVQRQNGVVPILGDSFLAFAAYTIILLVLMIKQLFDGADSSFFGVVDLLFSTLFLVSLYWVANVLGQKSSSAFDENDLGAILRSFVNCSLLLGLLWGILSHIVEESYRWNLLSRTFLGYPLFAFGMVLWIRNFTLFRSFALWNMQRQITLLNTAFGVFWIVTWLGEALQLSFLQIISDVLFAALLLFALFLLWKMPSVGVLSHHQRVRLFWQTFLAIIALPFAYIATDGFADIYQNILPGAQTVILWLFLLAFLWNFRILLSTLLFLPAGRLLDRRTQEVEALTTVTKAISKEFDTRKIAELVTQTIPSISSANAAWISFPDAEEVVAYGLLQEHIQPFLSHPRLMEQLHAIDGTYLLVADLAQENELRSLYELVGFYCCSFIAIPLYVGKVRKGYLWAIAQNPDAFTKSDITLLLSFAESINLALERAELFAEAVQKQQYKKELEIARQIQRKLLPSVLPQIPSFHIDAYISPAYEVGGDYYDFIQLRNGKWCLLIGDVSGKGVSAALYAAELKGTILALAHSAEGPRELLCKVQSVLRPSLRKGAFITLLVVMLDIETGELVVARAGHLPLLIVRQSGEVHSVQPPGIAIGLSDSSLFESIIAEERVTVQPGDFFIAFTDGLLDVHNQEEQMFGIERLTMLLSSIQRQNGKVTASDVIGTLLREISTFSRGESQYDDITMVVGVAAYYETAERKFGELTTGEKNG